MSWIRSSKGTALVVLLAVSLLAVGVAGAISVDDSDVRNESQVGETVEETIVVEDPFVDRPGSWTLQMRTDLENVSWTVTVHQQGTQISEANGGGQTFEQDLVRDNGGDEVRITVRGDTPAIDSYSYQPRETYALVELTSVAGDSQETFHTTEVHHYTEESQQARQAIDDARETINETGANDGAENTLSQSISAYDSGNFGNAESLAGDASDEAEEAQQSEQTRQMLIYGGLALVVLVLLGGGIYYWRSQQDDYQKLQ